MGNYFIYTTTNPGKTVLYTGVTNDLKTFAGRYYCYNLIYFERFDDPESAIDREKEIKGWRRSKKEGLINKPNPRWYFYNESLKHD